MKPVEYSRVVGLRCGVFLIALTTLGCAAVGDVTLDTNTNIRIVQRGQFGNAAEATRDLLGKYLRLALKKDKLAGDGPTVTFVLESDAERWQNLPPATLLDITDIDSYKISVTQKPQPTIHIRGRTALATNFGIMDVLEHDVGITWLFPGPLGVQPPRQSTIRVKAMTRRSQPVFASRIFTGLLIPDPVYRRRYAANQGVLRDDRHFFTAYDYHKSMRMHNLSYASHALKHVYPPDKIAKTHPEIFPIYKGKRFDPTKEKKGGGGRRYAWQPCYAQQATYDLAIQYAKKQIAGGAHTVSLGVNDGRNVLCECEYCSSIGWPDVYYQFVNRVADGVSDKYPPHMVACLAYGSVKQPPSFKLRDNVMINVTGYNTQRFEQWSKVAKNLGIYEWMYGIWYWVPNLPLDVMAANARFYRKHNVRFLHNEAYPLWAFDAPKLFIRARQLWSPPGADLNVYAELARYCRAAFGDGHEPMIKLYEHWAAKPLVEFDPKGLSALSPMAVRQYPSRQFEHCSASDYQLTTAWLDEADVLATTDVEHKRIDMVRTFFDYSAVTFSIYQLYDELTDASRSVSGDVAVRIDAVKQQRQRLLDRMRDHPQWFVGTSTTYETIVGPRWGQMAAIEYQLDLAAASARYRDRGGRPVKKYIRKTHGWFVRDGDTPLPATIIKGDAITFSVTADADAKRYWTSALLLKVPLDDSVVYTFNVNVSAASGMVDVHVDGGAGNRSRGRTRFAKRLGGSQGEVTRMQRFIAFEPLFIDPTTAERTEPPPGITGNVNLYISWSDFKVGDVLQGRCVIRKIKK